MVATEDIKQLREETGISVAQCKKALEEAEGDKEKALEVLRQKSREVADKKAERELGAGTVQAYIHGGGAVGAMVELRSETDFVSKNEEFMQLAYDIAMHVAAMNPVYTRLEEIDEDERARIEEMFKEEVEKEDKPEEVKQKMLEGKINTFLNERTLLEQTYVKDQNTLIKDLLNEAVQKFGENVELSRFARFSVA